MDLGQVFTGKTVADYMVSLFSDKDIRHILEPCFGEGAFLRACLDAGYENVDGCEIDKELYCKTAKEYPMYHLHQRDFFQYEPECKYDGIIMNPPYIRQEKIDDLEAIGITKKLLRGNDIFAGLPSTANLYMYFIIKAIELLREEGELVVIFPSSWMTARSGKDFRKQLFANTRLIKEVHIYGDVFEKDALVEVVILKLVKGKGNTSAVEPVYMELSNQEIKRKEISETVFDLSLPVSFHKYARVRRGLTTGWNKMFINPSVSTDECRSYITRIISSPKCIEGYNTDTALTDDLLMIAPGQKLNDRMKRYIDAFRRQLIEEKRPKTLYKMAQESKEWYTLNTIDSDGILFSYFVRNDMKFIMNTANILARDNFYIIYPEIDPYLMFALLNNYYTYYQLELIGKKYGAGLLKLQRYDIENLKFIDIAFVSADDMESLIQLSKELAEEMKTENIERITGILSKYADREWQEITVAYEKIKRKRLEAS